MLIVLFLVSHFNFLFVPCVGLSWLPVSFLLHGKYTLSHGIVSYRMVWYRTKRYGNIPTGTPQMGASNAGGVE